MKILTGEFRGQTVLFKSNPHLRPTSDKVRKAIFDMLQGALLGKDVLDLFSGTGALGIEALSAGAAQVVFVEFEKSQAKQISESLLRLGLEQRGTVIPLTAAQAIQKLVKGSQSFDIIFMDPPYEDGLGFQTLDILCQSPILKKNAWLIWECPKKEIVPDQKGPFKKMKSKIYGYTQVVIFKVQ